MIMTAGEVSVMPRGDPIHEGLHCESQPHKQEPRYYGSAEDSLERPNGELRFFASMPRKATRNVHAFGEPNRIRLELRRSRQRYGDGRVVHGWYVGDIEEMMRVVEDWILHGILPEE